MCKSVGIPHRRMRTHTSLDKGRVRGGRFGFPAGAISECLTKKMAFEVKSLRGI